MTPPAPADLPSHPSGVPNYPPLSTSSARPGTTSHRAATTQTLLAILLALFVVGFLTRALWLGRHFPALGDWQPLTRAMAPSFFHVWSSNIQGGAPNTNIPEAPWIGPLAWAAGAAGSPQFYLVNSFALCAPLVLALLVAYFVASNRWHVPRLQAALLAAFFSFNPWATAEFASGHVSTLLGYALLPIFLFRVPPRKVSTSLLIGLLVGVEFSFDIHMALLAELIQLITIASFPSQPSWGRVKSIIVSGVTALLVSSYWLGPVAFDTATARSAPLGIQESLRTLMSLTRFDSVSHILELRSFWYPPFTQRLYDFTPLTRLLPWLLLAPTIVAALSTALHPSRWPARPFLVASALLSLGFLGPLVLGTHTNLLASVSRLPGGDLLRDPNILSPLLALSVLLVASAVFALASAGLERHALAGDLPSGPATRREPGRLIRLREGRAIEYALSFSIVIALTATLAPWLDGSLRSNLTMPSRPSGVISGFAWISHHVPASARILVLPADGYIYLRYPSYEVGNFLYSWIDHPTIGPIEDPAFDFNPASNAALLDLEAGLDSGMPTTLGRVMRQLDVSYIVIDFGGLPRFVARSLSHALANSTGISEVYSHGGSRGLMIYHIRSSTLRPSPVRVNRIVFGSDGFDTLQAFATLFPSGSVLLTPALAPSIIRAHSSRFASYLTSSFFSAVFRLVPTHAPSAISNNAAILTSSGGLAYQLPKGRSLSTDGGPFTLVSYVGRPGSLVASCDAHQITPLVSEVAPYDYSFGYSTRFELWRCQGRGQLRSSVNGTWISSVASVSSSGLGADAHLAQALLSNPGSAYVLRPAQLVQVPRGTAVSPIQNPLELQPGRYVIQLRFSEPRKSCTRALVVAYPEVDPAHRIETSLNCAPQGLAGVLRVPRSRVSRPGEVLGSLPSWAAAPGATGQLFQVAIELGRNAPLASPLLTVQRVEISRGAAGSFRAAVGELAPVGLDEAVARRSFSRVRPVVLPGDDFETFVFDGKALRSADGTPQVLLDAGLGVSIVITLAVLSLGIWDVRRPHRRPRSQAPTALAEGID